MRIEGWSIRRRTYWNTQGWIQCGEGQVHGFKPLPPLHVSMQCIDDVCRAFVKGHLKRLNLCSFYVWSAVELVQGCS